MSSLEFDGMPEPSHNHRWAKGTVIGLTAGLVLALAGDGYLLKRTSDTNDQMARMQDETHSQINKLGDATDGTPAAAPQGAGR